VIRCERPPRERRNACGLAVRASLRKRQRTCRRGRHPDLFMRITMKPTEKSC